MSYCSPQPGFRGMSGVHALQREKSVVVETKGVGGAVDWTIGRLEGSEGIGHCIQF